MLNAVDKLLGELGIDMKSTVDTLLKKHQKLTQSDHMKVASHVQREADEWIVNTLMIEGHNIPFIYKRKRPYRSLTGQRSQHDLLRCSRKCGRY